MEGSTLFEWADRLKALRDRKEALEAELKQVNVDICLLYTSTRRCHAGTD